MSFAYHLPSSTQIKFFKSALERVVSNPCSFIAFSVNSLKNTREFQTLERLHFLSVMQAVTMD